MFPTNATPETLAEFQKFHAGFTKATEKYRSDPLFDLLPFTGDYMAMIKKHFGEHKFKVYELTSNLSLMKSMEDDLSSSKCKLPLNEKKHKLKQVRQEIADLKVQITKAEEDLDAFEKSQAEASSLEKSAKLVEDTKPAAISVEKTEEESEIKIPEFAALS